nr:MAG TPA: hypothetical protein [Caudoviricetes sp.]
MTVCHRAAIPAHLNAALRESASRSQARINAE